LSSTRDCSRKISGEHYISRSILEQFPEISLTGLRWINPGESVSYGIDSLTSKILCTRHNSALSPLDTHAGKFFHDLGIAQNRAANSEISKSTYFLYSGDALEKWATKTLLGLFYAGILSIDGEAAKRKLILEDKSIIGSIFGRLLGQPCGLRIAVNVGDLLGKSIGIAPLHSPVEGTLNGLLFSMHGMQFQLLTDSRGGSPEYLGETRYYRPWVIDLEGVSNTSRIILTWENQRYSGARVAFGIEPHTS
jgi:hypothetical protein